MAMLRRPGGISALFSLDLVPFLSVMLGFMSVMALTTLGISYKQREQEQAQRAVKLVGVPSGLVPVQMRCRPGRLEWLSEGRWSGFDIAFSDDGELDLPPLAMTELLRFLDDAVGANRRLSYQGQRHTLLLWVEPRGDLGELLVTQLVERMHYPLRIGQLPIMPNEEITGDAPARFR